MVNNKLQLDKLKETYYNSFFMIEEIRQKKIDFKD